MTILRSIFVFSICFILFTVPSHAQYGNIPQNIQDQINNQLGQASPNNQANDGYSDADRIWRKDFKLQRFLNYYYLNEPIFQTPQMMQRLVSLGFMDQDPIQQNYVIGFFAALFKQNPEIVPNWLDTLDVSQYQGAAFVRAARHAGLTAIIQDWSDKNGWVYEDKTVFEAIPMPIDEELTSAEDVQRLWGAYAVDGSTNYLGKLFDRMLETNVKASQEEILKGELDNLKLQAVNETIEGLFITAGRQYKDVENFILIKSQQPEHRTDQQLSKIIYKVYKVEDE